MRNYLVAASALMLAALAATILYSNAQDIPSPPAEQQSDRPSPSGPPGGEPTMTVLDHHEVVGILGKEVRSATDENMGRIIDVIVDRAGQVRAAIIDFGGFLGVGSRKMAVAWNALHFASNEKKSERIALELTRDQVRAAPEYKEDRQVVVLGASGSLESLPEP